MPKDVVQQVDKTKDHLHQIEKCRHEVALAQADEQDTAHAHKRAKARLDAAMTKLLSTIDNKDDLPLLDGPRIWEEVLIGEIGLPPAISKILERDGVANLLNLEAEISTEALQDHDGIGAGTVKQIGETLLAFLKAHPELGHNGKKLGETQI